jgi:hypothetical protein
MNVLPCHIVIVSISIVPPTSLIPLSPNVVPEVALGITFVVSPLIPFDAKDAVVANELLNADVAKDELIEVVANELDIAVVAKEALTALDELIANELDNADVANEAVPSNEPVNAVEVTDVNPAIVVAVPPKLIAVLPTVILEFARLALVIPAVPLKLELVNPDIDPPNVIVPVLVIVPPVKVIPETDPAVATEVTPLLTTLVAHDAVPNNEPVNAVDVTEVSPAIVVAVVPRLIAVLPTVILLFAKFAFVMPAVPLRLALVNPEIDPPSVIVPVDVIVPPVNVMPDTDPAVATEVTPIPPTTLPAVVAKDAVPSNDPVNELAQTLPLTVKEADVGVIVPMPIFPLLPDIIPPPLPNLIEPTVESCTP